MLNLKDYLKLNKNARKIFGRKELEIIFKQLEGMPLTQSEKNRLSRDIRPKFQFIEEISEFRDEFKLEKNQDNKKLIEKAVDIILKDELKDSIKAILLFGSFADKSFTKSSDIDICAVFKKDLPLKEATKFRIRISGQLPEKVDVQVFNVLPQKIKKDIARNHKVLYHGRDYDNINFSVKYLKDEDYFIRMNKIFEAEA
ncbi:nucleotidyltransferase domain-containing protein [Candidatus Woesearchaeota archaeon]|nr:nucleotidyltransferase domain-containing protein [Candidatus Woesearchaeota archaeon]